MQLDDDNTGEKIVDKVNEVETLNDEYQDWLANEDADLGNVDETH